MNEVKHVMNRRKGERQDTSCPKVNRLTTPSVFFLLSLVLHVTVILVVGHYGNPVLWENGQIAQNLWDGKGFAMGLSRTGEATSWQAPGYPYFVVLFWLVFGQTKQAYLLLSLLQALAVSLMVFPVHGLAMRWYPGRGKVAIWAMLITVLMPLYAWYATRMHHTALVMALHPWLLYLWLELKDCATWRGVFVTGIMSGLGGLFQPVLLLVYGLIGLYCLMLAIGQRAWRQTARIACAGLLVVIVIIPWTARNYAVHGRLMVIKNSFGKEFWMGNNPHATGTGFVDGGAQEITQAYPPACFILRGKVSEMELMDALQSEALSHIRQEPLLFVKRTIKRIAWFWTFTPTRFLRSFSSGEAHKFQAIHISYWLLFVLLMFMGFMKAYPSKEYIGVLLCFVLCYSAIYGLTHVGQARFRGEMEFIFIPAVAMGMQVVLEYLRCHLIARGKQVHA